MICYLKSLFLNFLVVFFANHLLPGIMVAAEKKLPHIGGDLLFATALGILNSLIYPFLRLLNRNSSQFIQLALFTIVVNFVAYALLFIVPLDLKISSMEGYFLPAGVVTIASFIINFFAMKSHQKKPTSHSDEEPPSNH
jgi:uncharacterized membrane protein YvlD (DUF360 family)